jgi:uncharacterized membrane protein YgdD (TMEM256/DUF423 family)
MIKVIAALSAAIAIGAAAFGAHWASGGASGDAKNWLETGGLYQLVTAVAVFALADRHTTPTYLMLAGASVFALTLYAMALGAPRILGAVTPIGGAAIIAAWVWIAVRELRV